jgi:cytoskeletal protein CcmA (bactofilin family)
MFGKSKEGNDQMLTPVKQPSADQASGGQPSGGQPSGAQPSGAQPGGQPSGGQRSTDQVSAISRDITVVGRIFGEGTVKILGRIEGELKASTVWIQEGAQVEGDVVAEDLTVAGQVKGTIHANRVKLNSTALVEGDIFHRSLSIEENARFEGSSKREDKAVDLPRIPLKAPAVQDREDKAVDLPRIPLGTSAVQDNVQVKVDAIAGKRKSNGHGAMADTVA